MHLNGLEDFFSAEGGGGGGEGEDAICGFFFLPYYQYLSF
jgi:hypothetical protein